MNKKVLNVILGTILSFMLILTIDVPKANSLFVLETNNDQKIAYQSTLVNPYGGTGVINRTGIIENEFLNKIKLSFTLPRNETVRNDIENGLTDQYSFSLSGYGNCDITRIISTNSKGITVSTSGSIKTITYDVKDEDSMVIDLVCPVTVLKTGNKLKLPIQVKEKIYEPGNSEAIEEFVYMDYKYEELYSSYEADLTPEVENPEYPITNSNPITFSIADTNDKDLHGNFIAWLNKVYENNALRTHVLTYVNSKYPNKAALLDDTISLPGMDINCNTTECIFTIVENFDGYVNTSTTDFSEGKMFFSTTDETAINEAFKYYLEAYFYPGDENADLRDEIYAYAYNNPASMITGTNKVKYGFFWRESSKCLTLQETLLDYIAMTKVPYEPQPFPLSYSGSKLVSEMRKYLENSAAFTSAYMERLKTGDLNDIYEQMRTSIKKNGVDFEDYYFFHDTENDSEGNPVNNYIMVKIYSNAGSDPADQNNYIFIKNNFVIPAGVDIKFYPNELETDTIVPITISSMSLTDIATAKIALETYFGEDKLVYADSNTDGEGLITVTYNYTKSTSTPSTPSPKKTENISKKIADLKTITDEEVKASESKKVESPKNFGRDRKVGKVAKGTAKKTNEEIDTKNNTKDETTIDNTVTEDINIEDSVPTKPIVRTDNTKIEEAQSINETLTESN